MSTTDPEHIFIALTTPVDGREDEFNQFYDDVHVPDILGARGWAAARRYKLSPTQRPDQSPPWLYMAVYELSLPPQEAIGELAQRPDVGPHGRPQPPLWNDGSAAWYWSACGPRREADQSTWRQT
jgi:hypothetical protein